MLSRDQASQTMTKPGNCVSVNQLESSTPGLIGQLRGAPTAKQHHEVATVFIDHRSGLGCTHLQKSAAATETVEAKKAAFERCAASHGVFVRHCHANDGHSADNLFHQAVTQKSQTLSFCCISAHFQSGAAKRRFGDLQDHAHQRMLAHANKRWPVAITPTNLWPDALRAANSLLNETPSLKFKQSPSERFAGTHESSHAHLLESTQHASARPGQQFCIWQEVPQVD